MTYDPAGAALRYAQGPCGESATLLLFKQCFIIPFCSSALRDTPCDGYKIISGVGHLQNAVWNPGFSVYLFYELHALFRAHITVNPLTGVVTMDDPETVFEPASRKISSGENFLDCLQEFNGLIPVEQRFKLRVAETLLK